MQNNFLQGTNQFSSNSRYVPPMFMQPQGSLYIIDNSLELANVPMGAGISVAICPNESLVYLKMYQNGSPQVAAYTLVPYEKKEPESQLDSAYKEIIQRLESLEEKIEKKGGKVNEYI